MLFVAYSVLLDTHLFIHATGLHEEEKYGETQLVRLELGVLNLFCPDSVAGGNYFSTYLI